MRYYILRTNVKSETTTHKLLNGYNFKINNSSNDSLLLLGFRSVESNRPSTKYEALFAERKPLNIRYLPYSTPNCGIIPTSKKKVEEILNVAV